ncbi:ABC transporter permease [Mammaliicoccus lentus]|uniref:ABC transporter permease n=1 Tax=Mammaliicoccus lentus TaxID=42858 RepID=UPI001B322DA4|nr:ABC transporter permease [Mammaliicoccus lentus]
MKPIFNLVVLKQWVQYIILILFIILTVSVVFMVEASSNKVFKVPIAIQDMDQSSESKNLIHTLEHTKYLEVIKLQKDEAYIEDVIQKKQAIVSMQIPEGFNKKLSNNNLRDAIPLYYKDDFIGEIALEVTSKALYEQQIPIIIQKHLDKSGQDVSLKTIKNEYKKDTPNSKMEQHAVNKNSDVSISAGLIIALLLVISTSQIVLHQRLKQNAALERLLMFNNTKMKLYSTYILTHTLLLFFIIFITGLCLSWSLSFKFYLITFLILLIYEFGLSILLFKINTLSHKIFMALLWAIAINILYVFIQI